MSSAPGRAHRDVLFVGLVTALTVALQQTGLGFYSDDWGIIANFEFSPDRTLEGLFRVLYADSQTQMRPGQVLYLAALYATFGVQPQGYHIVNGIVIVSTGLLLYAVLRELRVPRSLSVAVSIVYAVLPHYSTARLWYASFQACLSMALYLGSLLAGLRSLRSAGWRASSLQALSVLALVTSTLLYEVALPLFGLNAAVYALQGRGAAEHAGSGKANRWSGLPLAIATMGAMVAVAAFKALASTRTTMPSAEYIIGMVKQALKINLWTYGLALPRTLWRAVPEVPAGSILAAGALLAAITLYLRRVNREDRDENLDSAALRLVGWGSLVALAGHLVFLTNNIGLSPTGANNRVHVAAALGVAMIWAGLLAWIAQPGRLLARASVYSALLAVLAVAFFLISTRLSASWVAAARQQEVVLAAMKQAFPTLPPRSTLLLDGVCRYDGPGIIFEAYWDIGGALRLQYRDTTLQANIVSRSLTVAEDGIRVVLYGGESLYEYGGDPLFMFNARRATIHRIGNATAAHEYFARYNPDRSSGCLTGREGHGTRLF